MQVIDRGDAVAILAQNFPTIGGVGPRHVFPSGSASKHGYFLELDYAKGCQGANACFLASFSGQRGGKPQFKRKVSLTHGITGYFRPVTCGASCAPR